MTCLDVFNQFAFDYFDVCGFSLQDSICLDSFRDVSNFCDDFVWVANLSGDVVLDVLDVVEWVL